MLPIRFLNYQNITIGSSVRACVFFFGFPLLLFLMFKKSILHESVKCFKFFVCIVQMLWVNYCCKVKACRNLIPESDNKLHLMVSLCDMFSLFIFCNIMHRWIAMITREPRHESKVFCLRVSIACWGKCMFFSRLGFSRDKLKISLRNLE